MTAASEDMIECPPNVIPAYFGEAVYDEVYNQMKFAGGPAKTEQGLLADGYHPSFVKAVVKKLCKERGW